MIAEGLSRDMYKEHILDLYRRPSNFGTLDSPTHEHRGYNPLCGDDITIQLMVKDGKVDKVRFKGRGCAISIASASLLTDSVKGKSVEDVLKLSKEHILKLLGIDISPVRLKCALLPLASLHISLLKKGDGDA